MPVSPLRILVCLGVFCALSGLCARQADAQDTATSDPLVLQRIENGFVAAPDVKFSNVDGRTATLVGGYAGWVMDRSLLIGGGGYWMATSSDDELGYGGLVVEWITRPDSAVRFGVKGLVGFGTATLATDVGVSAPFARFGSPGRPPGGIDIHGRHFLVRDDFFCAEPSATLRLRLMRYLGVNLGVGYRVTGEAEALGDRLNGVTGSVAFQIGGW